MQATDSKKYRKATGKQQSSRLRACHIATSLFLFALLMALAIPAHAQYRTSIQGTVTDSTGAVIPGALLTLTNIGTNEKQVRHSDAAGIFNFNALPPDAFTLVAEKKGFQKVVLNKLTLIPEQPNSVNVQMAVGADSETVTVDASAGPTLDTETADNGATISENEIQHMPSFQRDVTQLIQLAPGVLADGAQDAGGGGFLSPGTQTNASSGGGGNLGHSSSIFATENGASASANGGQYETNGYTIDGISTVSVVWGGATVITPSEESVGSVKVVTNAYDAENSRFSGALTEITSKSGTNQVHGSIFAQIVRPGLDAYQRWNGPASVAPGTPQSRGLQRDTDRYNQFGGSVGGPIWKNRVFAFFSYEGQSQNVASTGTGWFMNTAALTPLAPSGSIASTYLNFPGAAVLGTLNTSATCKDAGLTEGVNCTQISGQGLNIGSPLTTGLGTQDLTYQGNNNPGVGSGLSTVGDIGLYSTSNPSSNDFKQYNGRLDADVTKKDHASFAIYWVPATTTTYYGGLGYDLFNHSQVNDAFSGIWNHIFSPNFLNEARANAAGWRYNELESNPQAPFGLPDGNVDQIGNISIGNVGVHTPAHYDQWTYGYKDVATKVLHSQTMKFGFDFTRLYYVNDPTIPSPSYTFYNLWDFMNDAPEAEGGPFQAGTGIPGGYRNDNRENIFGAFFQDDWKMRPNLTLSAGLRYSYFGALTDKDDNMGVLLFGSGSDLLTGISLKTGIAEWTPQKFNFGPEVGFNWSPNIYRGKVVFRGGYGLNFNGQQIATANNDDNNPPGTNYLSESSQGPSEINPDIVYQISTSPTNIYGYPANKNAKVTFNSAGLPTAGGANLSALPNNMPTEYAHHYSLDTEVDFGHSIVANIGYEGSSAHHTLYNYNATALADIEGYPQNPLINSVGIFGSGGKSNNNMLLAGLKHNFSHTFSAEAQYTWAKSMDTDSGPYSFDPYLYHTQYSYGRSDFDIRNTFKAFGVWQPVFFHGAHNWAEKAVGGWSLSGILTLHTGYGWTPTFNNPNQIYCNTCQYGYANLRPTYIKGAGHSSSNDAFKTGSNFPNYDPNAAGTPSFATTGTPVPLSCSGNPTVTDYEFSNSYFNVPNFYNAITDCPGQATNTYIPAPGVIRNSFPGPGYRNVDFTFAKSFGLPKMRVLGEDAKFEIKANMFNAFNFLNINPSSINTNIDAASLGQANSALGSRMIDFQARFSF
jgi:Carboxypeptidase regulatory-like domain